MTRLTTVVWHAALAAVIVGATACGGGGDDGEDSPDSGGGVAWQGSAILFVNGSEDLCGMGADGTGKRILKAASFGQYDTFAELAISADGSKLVYTSGCGGRGFLRMIDRSLGNPTDLTPSCESFSSNDASFSPDGTKIAFIATNWTEAERGSYLYVMNADGSNPHRITPIDPDGYDPVERSPSFTHDGSGIVYTDNRAGHVVIAFIHVDGTGYTTFGGGSSVGAPVPFDPAVLWPGDMIFFGSASTELLNSTVNIYRASLGGSGATRLSNSDGASLRHPAPSADGLRVLYTHQSSFSDQAIGVLDAAGGSQTTLSDPAFSSFNDSPLWGP